MESVQGVYHILNLVNGKVYIGSSVNINRRFYSHKWELNNNSHVNCHLQNAWNKYGEHNFEFKIIEKVDGSYDDLLKAEQKWIDYFESYNRDKGYNISKYASGSGGYEVSDETKEKLRIAATGRHLSEETKKKLSEQRKGELNNFYGKHHTEEAKQKMSESKIGYAPTEKQLENLKNCRGNKYFTEETYKKLSLANRGENCGTSKLSEKDVIEILMAIKDGAPQKYLAEKYNVRESQISRIKNRQRWSYLYDEMPELYA